MPILHWLTIRYYRILKCNASLDSCCGAFSTIIFLSKPMCTYESSVIYRLWVLKPLQYQYILYIHNTYYNILKADNMHGFFFLVCFRCILHNAPNCVIFNVIIFISFIIIIIHPHHLFVDRLALNYSDI